MKNRIDEIWIERKELLAKYFLQSKWLIKSQMPLKQKCAIHKNNYDLFIKKLKQQDRVLKRWLG